VITCCSARHDNRDLKNFIHGDVWPGYCPGTIDHSWGSGLNGRAIPRIQRRRGSTDIATEISDVLTTKDGRYRIYCFKKYNGLKNGKCLKQIHHNATVNCPPLVDSYQLDLSHEPVGNVLRRTLFSSDWYEILFAFYKVSLAMNRSFFCAVVFVWFRVFGEKEWVLFFQGKHTVIGCYVQLRVLRILSCFFAYQPYNDHSIRLNSCTVKERNKTQISIPAPWKCHEKVTLLKTSVDIPLQSTSCKLSFTEQFLLAFDFCFERDRKLYYSE
jgi:hypothetical protein